MQEISRMAQYGYLHTGVDILWDNGDSGNVRSTPMRISQLHCSQSLFELERIDIFLALKFNPIMASKDPRVDTYIAKSADFAKPILTHIRELVHQGCPEVEETMKWSMPFFMYKGMFCHMASFKTHCSLGFWKSKLVMGKGGASNNEEADGMGQFGKISSLKDLPSDKKMLAYIKEAKRLNDEGIQKPSKPKPTAPRELAIPAELTAALKKNKKASATFEGFSYSHKKEYVEWITEAKREETKSQRLETTIAWLTEGKSRHWKYANC